MMGLSVLHEYLSSQGVIDLVLDCIDHLHQCTSPPQVSEALQGDVGEEWETILSHFYQLLGQGHNELICQRTFQKRSSTVTRLSFYSSASLIRGNSANCAHFSGSLDWLISRLDRLEASSGRGRSYCFSKQVPGTTSCLPNSPLMSELLSCSGVLEVLHCVLVESPEALNVVREGHIRSIISFLDTHGCNHKVKSVKAV